jgi:RecA/RadA recombinase
MIAQAQRYRDDEFPDGLVCAYYNAEGTFDELFARQLGVDTEKLILVNEFTETIEDLVIQLQALLEVAHIHVIDSVGAMTSRERIETMPGQKMSRASKARAWSDLMPDIQSRLDKQQNMILFIDQVRVHQQYGHEINSTSAVFDHASALDLHHRRIKLLYLGSDGEYLETRPQKSNVETVGNEVLIDAVEFGVEINKAKVCRPFGKARLRWDLNKEKFDRAFELKKLGIFLGVINQSGSYYTVPTQTKTIQGERKLCLHIEQDGALAMQIYSAMKKFIDERMHR